MKLNADDDSSSYFMWPLYVVDDTVVWWFTIFCSRSPEQQNKKQDQSTRGITRMFSPKHRCRWWCPMDGAGELLCNCYAHRTKTGMWSWGWQRWRRMQRVHQSMRFVCRWTHNFCKSASEWRAHNGWRVALLIVCVCDTKVGLLIDLPPND